MKPVPAACWSLAKNRAPLMSPLALALVVKSTMVACALVASKSADAAIGRALSEKTLIVFMLRLSFAWGRVIMAAVFMITIFLIIAVRPSMTISMPPITSSRAPAHFYRKPPLKRKQKNRLLAGFLTPPPIETWLGALVGWIHLVLPFPVSASMLRSGFYSVLNCV